MTLLRTTVSVGQYDPRLKEIIDKRNVFSYLNNAVVSPAIVFSCLILFP